MRAACRNDSLDWIVKTHPANLVKKHREGYVGEWAEIEAIRGEIGELPRHVRMLAPETDISTFSLYAAMDYCVTVRGTVGIEAALFGVRTLTAGTGRYDGLGFTVDSDTPEEFLGRLENLGSLPQMTPAQIELAGKFAWGVFMARPFKLESMRLDFERDATASTRVSFGRRSKDDLFAAPDMRKFAAWAFESTAEDYLDEDAMALLAPPKTSPSAP